MEKKVWGLGSTQVKFRFLISSIFDAMNFEYFLEMLEIIFYHFPKMLKIKSFLEGNWNGLRKMILGHTKREFSILWSLALKWDMFHFENHPISAIKINLPYVQLKSNVERVVDCLPLMT